jgi:hypothetical protein
MSNTQLSLSSLAARLLKSGAGILLCASVAEAQTDRTRWGAGGSVVPAWVIPTGEGPLAKLAEVVMESGEEGIDVDGLDFRVGIVRGRTFSGEWGVSFVRRSMKDGSTQGALTEDCQDSNPFGQPMVLCFVGGTRYTYQDVRMNGIEANKFIPFVTVKQRVQFGIDLGGGVGWMSGTAIQETPHNDFVPVRNAQGQVIGQTLVTTITTETVDASQLMVFDPTLLGRVEFAVAAILAPQLKVRFSLGMNFPGSHVASVGASYFFGRN